MALTPETRSILNTLETSLLALSADELRTFNEEFKDIIKRLENPGYALVKELEERRRTADKEFKAALAERNYERIKDLYDEIASIEQNYTRAQVDLVKPKESPKVKYLIGGKEVEWTGKGGGPKEIKDVLKKDGWNQDEKDAAKKKEQKMAILEKYRVK